MIEEAEVQHLRELEEAAKKSTVKKKDRMEEVFNAIHEYRSDPSQENLQAIKLQFVFGLKEDESTQYKAMEDYLTGLLEREKHWLFRHDAQEKLERNSFRTGSGLAEYAEAFPIDFADYRSRLIGGQRWLDAGAGQAKAMIEYLNEGGQADCIACSYKIPDDAKENVKAAHEKFGDRFVYVDGKYFSQFTDQELQADQKKFDLITDLNGVLYYTSTFLDDLARYISILNVGGKIFFSNPVGLSMHLQPGEHNPVGPLALADWLANIGDVQVKGVQSKLSLIITKVGDRNQFPATVQTEFVTEPGINSPKVTLKCSTQLVARALWV